MNEWYNNCCMLQRSERIFSNGIENNYDSNWVAVVISDDHRVSLLRGECFKSTLLTPFIPEESSRTVVLKLEVATLLRVDNFQKRIAKLWNWEFHKKVPKLGLSCVIFLYLECRKTSWRVARFLKTNKGVANI